MDSSNLVGDVWKYNPEYHRTAEFLGVDKYDRDDYDTAEKISFLRDWAGLKGKSDTHEEALNVLSTLRKDLGVQTQGKLLVKQLFQHVRLSMDSERSKKEADEKRQKALQAKKLAEAKMKAEEMTEKQIADTFKKTLIDKDLIQSTVQAVVADRVNKTVNQALDRIMK